MPVTYCDVFAFLWRSIQTMGCSFFDCFWVRNNQPRLVSNSSPSTATEEVANKIRLSSLFTAEDKEDGNVAERENLVQWVERSEIDEELLEEAKFLKACGALPETPAEIRNAVTRTETLEKSDIQRPLSMLNSSPESPGEIEQADMLPEKLQRSGLCIPPTVLESSPVTPEEIQKAETYAVNFDKSDPRRPRSVLKSSPYPTPRNIIDDMQTPGTVFATNMSNLAKGNVRIRSQYVYTVVNPIESKEENSIVHETPDYEGKCLSEEGKKENIVEASLSSWLRPQLASDADASCRKPNMGRTPGDKPIIGLVATHWNEQEETSRISPKWWDGNGIPNSTTKYKEDQKVRWHATPFEERLEKALSEETSVPQRKPITGAPIVFEDTEGHDTATSQLQSININCPKSVESF